MKYIRTHYNKVYKVLSENDKVYFCENKIIKKRDVIKTNDNLFELLDDCICFDGDAIFTTSKEHAKAIRGCGNLMTIWGCCYTKNGLTKMAILENNGEFELC